MPNQTEWRNFIGGDWSDASDGGIAEVINPATEQVIAMVPLASSEDVNRTVEAARRAFGEWSKTTPGERAAMLFELADRVEENQAELGSLESANVGKPLSSAVEEMQGVADVFRFFAGAARALQGPVAGEYQRGYTSMVRREPIGVAVGIAPWNYPLGMAAWKIGPALATGNASILKPAEETPLTALKLAELAQDILPPGVLNVINGHGHSVGDALVRHPHVDHVSLTGETATGIKVAQAASATLKRTHLELGGKSPVIIFDDADVETAAAAIRMAGYMNSGQDCGAASRVIVGSRIYDEFMSALIDQVSAIKVGDPAVDGGTEMGPVVSSAQFLRVTGFLERAVDASAEIVVGGGTLGRPGYFVKPTIVVGVDQRSEIVEKEVFGPVVSVERFGDPDEAIRWANDTPFRLSASVHTQNVATALSASRALRFGTVWINTHGLIPTEMPWGGYGLSGYGKDQSIYALEDYTQVKHVMALA